MRIVHVVGTGTIGAPLISLLARYRNEFDIDEVTFHKNTPLSTDISTVKQLLSYGAVLSTDADKFEGFRKLGVEPRYNREQAIERASVVIDCTPKGVGLENKKNYYEKYVTGTKGFVAQGSESGFGKPFAYKVNDQALESSDSFLQVVSCNTHNICALVNTFMRQRVSYVAGDFVCIRRASDISQDDDFIPGIEVDKHKHEDLGTHHAVDATRVFKTLSSLFVPKPSLYSSSCIVSSQYMHCLRFSLSMSSAYKYSKDDIVKMLQDNPLIAVTNKTTTNSVFSFGRDFGHNGRILNQTVVSLPTLAVRHFSDSSGWKTVVTGFCFTPQDANSLLSSVAAALWYLNDKNFEAVDEKLSALSDYVFQEI